MVGALWDVSWNGICHSAPGLNGLPWTPDGYLCVGLGLFFDTPSPKSLRTIVVGGPPIAIVLGYEYLVYERGIDLQEVLSEVPIISEPHPPSPASFGLLHLSHTHFQDVPKAGRPHLHVGLALGGLIKRRQDPPFNILLESPEDRGVYLRTFGACSIALQIYSKFYRGKGEPRRRGPGTREEDEPGQEDRDVIN